MTLTTSLLWDDPTLLSVNTVLEQRHYLGPLPRAATLYRDDFGILAFAPPTSRQLPTTGSLELARWCLYGERNAGSRQWPRAAAWVAEHFPEVTTVVSYSDPAHGHTGALYRACNWLWAPTWLRLRPPPSGQGSWGTDQRQSVKDRWVYPLRPDSARASFLAVNDGALLTRWPWASYREPAWRGVHRRGGGGDYRRWQLERAA